MFRSDAPMGTWSWRSEWLAQERVLRLWAPAQRGYSRSPQQKDGHQGAMNGMVRANSGNPKSRGRDEGIKWVQEGKSRARRTKCCRSGRMPPGSLCPRDKDSHLQDACEPRESLWEGLAVSVLYGTSPFPGSSVLCDTSCDLHRRLSHPTALVTDCSAGSTVRWACVRSVYRRLALPPPRPLWCSESIEGERTREKRQSRERG